jgi:lysophospholipase L1-like esterase
MKRYHFHWVVRSLVDLLILLHLIGLIAVLWSGGYRVELGVFVLKSHSILSVLRGLALLCLFRVLVTSSLKNFLVLCGSLFICSVVTEGVLRIWDTPLAHPNLVQIHRPSELYDYELVPGSSGFGKEGEFISVNSWGMRDHEVAKEKTPGLKRIAVIGDSFTFGMGVDLGDTYVKQLERRLRAQGMSVEVLNFGVSGYNMWQYRIVFERRVLAFNPDLIVVGFFLDDLEASIPPYEKDESWKPVNRYEQKARREFKVSYLWNLVRNLNQLLETKYRYRRGYRYLQGIDERKREIGPDHPENVYYRMQVGNMGEALYMHFCEVLGSLAATAKDKGIPLVALYIPDASQLHERERQHVNRFLRKATVESGIPMVDATIRFEGVADPKPLYLFPLDAHTSPEGHRIIAESLAEELLALNLL